MTNRQPPSKVNRVRSGEALTTELGKVIDETFPVNMEELVDINSRCKELVEYVQEEHLSIVDLLQLLDKAYDINIEAHERLGATEFLPLSQSSSRASSQIGTPISSGTSSPMPRTIPMLPNVSLLTAERLAPQQSFFGSNQGFQFSVVKNPERLSITWPSAWGDDFLTAVMHNAQYLRELDQDPTMTDFTV
jgi:hypothetical protein